jgi:hypothetical protein
MTRGFVRHYVEMVVAMFAGMGLLMPVWGLLAPRLGWDSDRAEVMALVMATTMTLGMTAWMAFRRHGAGAIAEMAAAMYLSFLVLFPPLWLGWIGRGTMMLVGHLLMLPAMWLVMLRRRAEYEGHSHAAAR